jgi:hypothetical protein
MRSKENARQRPLFADWPAWQELPTQVQQQIEKLLANMYLEVVNPSHEVHVQEQRDELPAD